MGADTFYTVARGASVREAFNSARNTAIIRRGNEGYTGTIAEKSSYTLIIPTAAELTRATDASRLWCRREPTQREVLFCLAEQLVGTGDPRVDDKWGPAGVLELSAGEWLFFGWASS